MNRREFISTAAAAAGTVALSGFAAEGERKIRREIRAMHVRLGSRFREVTPWDPQGRFYGPTTEIFLDSLDRRVAKMAACGHNVILLELMEGLRLRTVGKAVPDGAVTPKELNAHIRAWKEQGVRTVPLVNFSVLRSGWMGFPSRMVATKPYYAFCTDVLKEVYDVLEKPRIIHLGLEDETNGPIISWKAHFSRPTVITRRMGKILWHDVRFLIDQVEKAGARAWLWETGPQEEFAVNVPKSALVSPRYFGNDRMPGEDGFEKENRVLLKKSLALADAGFRLVPCGIMNTPVWFLGKQDAVHIDRWKNPAMLVGYVRKHLPEKQLCGFVDWCECPAGPKGENLFGKACDAFARALESPIEIPDEAKA